MKMGYSRLKEPYWYIVVLDVDGHDYLLPGGDTEQAARQKAISVLKHGELYEVKPYLTHDLSEATRQYKHGKLMQTQDFRQAVTPVKHTIPDSHMIRTDQYHPKL
jgi:hypothetical protein